MRLFTLSVLLVLLAVPAAWACSVFMAEDGQKVWAGNNEDYYGDDPTAIWFVPADGEKYGYVAYGYASNYFAQGGMNDQGLFFDGLATPYLEMVPDPYGKQVHMLILEETLQHCATVDEAVTHLREYDLAPLLENAQLFFADANGDSLILEGADTWDKAENYLISTNFYHSAPELGNHPCWRYDTIQGMMESGLELNLDYFTSMADAAHQGSSVDSLIFTRYATIADLANGIIYLYYELDFVNYIEINLGQWLADGEASYLMDDLFNPSVDGDDDDDDDDDNNDGGIGEETGDQGQVDSDSSDLEEDDDTGVGCCG